MKLDQIKELYQAGALSGASGGGMAFIPEAKHELRLSKAAKVIHGTGASTVLDVGCGIGLLALKIPEVQYSGVDIVPEFIDRASKSIPGSFMVGQVSDVHGSYDLVVCLGVLSHITDEELGSFVASLTVPAKKYLVLDAHSPAHYSGRFCSHSMTDITAALTGAGFSVSSVTFSPEEDSGYLVLGVRDEVHC